MIKYRKQLFVNLFSRDEECYRKIHFRDNKTGAIYTDLLEIQVLELRKLPSEIRTEEDVINWMRFFSGKTRKEFEHMAKMNEYLDEAYNTLTEISADEEKRLEYEAREKALKDYNTQMLSAKNRGIKQGKEQFSKLIASLARQDRMDDIIRVTEDEEYQEKLMKEFEREISEA